jgi:HEPN domain-containing protein
MGTRYPDWIGQGRRDLGLARAALAAQTFEWSCFAAQQAAEKALKGLFDFLGAEAWGHSLTRLLGDLEDRVPADPAVLAAARQLDRLYVPTRYPNGFAAGKPGDYFTLEDANAAIVDAERVLAWVEQLVR